MSKLQYLKDELEAIGSDLRKTGVYFRLIMSDDIDNMHDIRDRAKAGLNWLGQVDKDNGFFYGLCVGTALQSRIDNLVRNYKPQLLEVIAGGEPNWDEFGIEVVEDKAQNANLILFKNCCSGFYVSERKHTPREDRVKRTNPKDVAHKAAAIPKVLAGQVATSGKRKFTTIRHHVN
jgi:hypothetical protein